MNPQTVEAVARLRYAIAVALAGEKVFDTSNPIFNYPHAVRMRQEACEAANRILATPEAQQMQKDAERYRWLRTAIRTDKQSYDDFVDTAMGLALAAQGEGK